MSVPSNRCGFELEPDPTIKRSAVPDDEKIIYRAIEPEQWYRTNNVSCCWRPVWNGTDRCIWHAEVDTKPIEYLITARSDEPDSAVLDGAFLRTLRLSDRISFRNCRLYGADLSGAHLYDADLSGADLRYANLSQTVLSNVDLSSAELELANLSGTVLGDASLSNADFSSTDLSDATLWGVDLSRETLEGSILSDVDLRNANLIDANLKGADLRGADLRSTDLRGANLQGAELADINMNQETAIGLPREWTVVSADAQDSFARAYHSLGEIAKENGLVGKARRLRIWERRARRREAQANRNWRAWVGSLASQYVTGYGISIKRISMAIFAVILVCAGAYWITGVRDVTTFFQALDYSISIFTGIGPSNGPPIRQPIRSVAVLESFAGVLFSVLLGYVFAIRESP